MRLIDADSLERRIVWHDYEGYITVVDEAEIQNAPTIDTYGEKDGKSVCDEWKGADDENA